MNTNDYNPPAAARAQRELCRRRGVLQYAPSDGRCWACGEQIYSAGRAGRRAGITVREAGSRLITGCPICNRTFCD